jgi:Predicted integral membrane protein
MQICKFEDCFLNVLERRVIKEKEYIELTPKTFDLLYFLIEKRGEIVTKDEILGRVWNGSFVEEGNLAVHVSKLRRSLGADKNRPFIETVQGHGYRFVSDVKPIDEEEWRRQLPAKDDSQEDKESGESALNSIAVLPLENETRDPEVEYLSDGLTESFINNLSHLPGLKVIARNTVFRYKNKKVDPKAVGETLGVSAILTGRVRLIKNRFLINVELTKVQDNRQIWGKQLNQPFSDIVEVQENIISALTENLKSQIEAQNSPTNQVTQNSESYRLYLKGKHFFGKRTKEHMYKAIECFQRSVSLDPTNVYAYVEMIECYRTLYSFDYISYKDFSIKVQPLLAAVSNLNQFIDVVQVMHSRIKMYLDWKFDEVEAHLQQALRLNPNSLIARHQYLNFLTMIGRFSEALKEITEIMRLDPLSLTTNLLVARVFYRMEQYENALVYLNDAFELEPNNYEVMILLGAVLTELGKYQEASDILQKALDIFFSAEIISMLAYINALQGNKDMAYEKIKLIENQSNDKQQYSTILSRVYLALGEKELAYKHLEMAFNLREADLFALKVDPRWKELRNELRFKDLIRKVGIPQ